MSRTIVAFYLLLLSCAIGLSIYFSRLIGNIGVLAAYGIFLTISFVEVTNRQSRSLSEINIPSCHHPAIFIPAVVLWVVFTIGYILDPSFRAFQRLGAFTILSAISIFVVPAVISREQAFRAIGIFSAACTIVGFPTVFLGDYTILGLKFGQSAGVHLITSNIGYSVPAAFFDSVKYYRVLVAIGTICSGGLYFRTRDSWMGIAFVLNLFMVVLTVGRASILAVIVAGFLTIVYRFGNTRALAGVTLIGGCIVAVVVGISFGILPGPTELGKSLLGKRVGFWSASYQAFAARPIIGWGLADTAAIVSEFYPLGTLTGTHNSYLRLFVIGGSVGGVAYLLLCASALLLAFQAVRDHVPFGLTTFCLVVAALIFQLFDGATIFGTAISSILWAFVIGYAQPTVSSGDTVG